MLVHTDRALHYLCSLPPAAQLSSLLPPSPSDLPSACPASSSVAPLVRHCRRCRHSRPHRCRLSSPRCRRSPRRRRRRSTRLLQATTRLLAIRLLPGYYQATTRPLPGYYQATTRLLPGAARAPLGQQHRSSSPARLPAPLTPATRSRRRRSAHQWKELEEAVLHMPSKLDNSEDQARHISSCSRMQSVCSPACTQTSPTKTSTSSEPAWAKWTMMELFMADRHQHLPAATMLHVLDSTMLRLSRTSRCGRTASSRRAAAAARRTVGERAARTTVGLTCSHRRHERRERRDPPAFAIARNILTYYHRSI